MPRTPKPEERQPELTRKELSQTLQAIKRTMNLLRRSFAKLLLVSDERKPEIYKEVFRNAEIANLNYWLEIFFSIGIATLGLIMNSPAIVIGAMLISPLMGPIIAGGLAVALGDFYLGIRALLNVVLSSVGSILVAALITWILPFRSPTHEILSRVQPTLLDLVVAMMSGMIGAIVVCRGGGGGGVTAIPGVAVAVALIPPLGVIGFGVGVGWDWPIISGGGLLYLTNLVAIIFSSFLVFFSVRLDTVAVRRQINEWLEETEKGEKLYEAIQHTPLRRLLGRVGTLPQRIATLLIFLVMVAVPLGRTLEQLREEANIRRAVLDELTRTFRDEYAGTEIVHQDIAIQPDHVRIGITALLPQGFSNEARVRLRERISSRIGRPVQLSVYEVATREELSAIVGAAATRAAPPVETFDQIREKLWSRVRPGIAASWPSDRAPLAGYSLALEDGRDGPTLRLAYLAEEELGTLGEEAVRLAVRERIGTQNVRVEFERVIPSREVEFPPGSAEVSGKLQQQLDALAETLRRFPGTRCAILIAQAEDAQPSSLALRRAEAVRTYLAEQRKIEPGRIQVSHAEVPSGKVRVQILPPPQP